MRGSHLTCSSTAVSGGLLLKRIKNFILYDIYTFIYMIQMKDCVCVYAQIHYNNNYYYWCLYPSKFISGRPPPNLLLWLLGTEPLVSESILGFWHAKMSQIHLMYSLPQTWTKCKTANDFRCGKSKYFIACWLKLNFCSSMFWENSLKVFLNI